MTIVQDRYIGLRDNVSKLEEVNEMIQFRLQGTGRAGLRATAITTFLLILSTGTLPAQSRDSIARARRSSDSAASAEGSYVKLVPRYGIRIGMSRAGMGILQLGSPSSPASSRMGRTAPVGGTFLDVEMMRSKLVFMGLDFFDLTFALRPELLYEIKGGGTFQSSSMLPAAFSPDSLYNLTTNRQLDYLEIPITLRISNSYGKVFGVSAHVGIYTAILITSTVERRYDYLPVNERPGRSVVERERLDAMPFDAGLTFGFSLDFSLYSTQLALDLRASSGFSPVIRRDEDSRLSTALMTLTWMVE